MMSVAHPLALSRRVAVYSNPLGGTVQPAANITVTEPRDLALSQFRSIAAFVVLQTSCFALAQVATLCMVIVYWGIHDIPWMILGLGAAELVMCLVQPAWAGWYQQRTLVLQSLWKTLLSFWALRLWCYTTPGKTVSAICFVWVELCTVYDVDCFCELVGQRCNRQQAEKLSSCISTFTVISLLLFGVSVYLTPWYKWMLPSDFMTIGGIFLLPCIFFLTVFARKVEEQVWDGEQLPASAAMGDQRRRRRQRRQHASADTFASPPSPASGEPLQVAHQDRADGTAGAPPPARRPCKWPLLVSMSIVRCMEGVYLWQFFTLLENALRSV